MEWTKVEALKAKKIAEKKITEMDVNGALSFALKAQGLCPTLDGLPQLLATLNIYVSAENRTNGEIDWYKVLGVQPSSDDETIRKSYEKLALSLYSDVNKAVGADGAFKILSEAWSVLSDRVKRISYDHRQNWRSMHKIIPNGNFSMPQNHDPFYSSACSSQNFSHTGFTGATHLTGALAPPPPYKPTSWTTCSICKMQFEFTSQYVNHHLHCPNCHHSFVAGNILPPPTGDRGFFSSQASSMLQQDSSNLRRNGYAYSGKQLSSTADSMGFCQSDLSGKTDPNGLLPQFRSDATFLPPPLSAMGFQSTFNSKPAWRTNTFMQNSGRAAGLSSNASLGSRLEAGEPGKKRRQLEPGTNGRMREDIASLMSTGTGIGGSEMVIGTRRIGGATLPNSAKELSQLETRNLLMQKARTEIQERLSGWNMVKQVAVKSSSSEKKIKEQHEEIENASSNDFQADDSKFGLSMHVKDTDPAVKPSCAASTVDTEADCSANKMTVPDPDFCDFDKDRVESSFGVNQIWAMYDDEDGMPRYYALIHNLISAKPFKMQIRWLNSKSNLEFSPVKWVRSGFSKTCGNFMIGKSEVYDSLNSFSHRVQWSKGTRGIIQIYPVKGDVWALYRNWSPNWDEFTPDEVIHSYNMVEVLEDYSEDCGVIVAPLEKVPGFRTVFQKHLDPSEIWTIPREEMFRFSHQVPSYKLSGQEASHAPKGCWELDPASTPPELLRVITESSNKKVSIGPRMPMGEIGVNGNKVSKRDVKKNKLEEAEKAEGKARGKELLVYERRRKRQNVCC